MTESQTPLQHPLLEYEPRHGEPSGRQHLPEIHGMPQQSSLLTQLRLGSPFGMRHERGSLRQQVRPSGHSLASTHRPNPNALEQAVVTVTEPDVRSRLNARRLDAGVASARARASIRKRSMADPPWEIEGWTQGKQVVRTAMIDAIAVCWSPTRNQSRQHNQVWAAADNGAHRTPGSIEIRPDLAWPSSSSEIDFSRQILAFL